MILKKFHCAIYGAIVLLFTDCTGEELNKKLKKDYGFQFQELDGLLGMVNQADIISKRTGEHDGTIYVIWVSDKKDFYCLVHECVHLAMRILSDREVSFTPNHQEPFAYYVEHWVRELWTALNPRSKKRKK